MTDPTLPEAVAIQSEVLQAQGMTPALVLAGPAHGADLAAVALPVIVVPTRGDLAEAVMVLPCELRRWLAWAIWRNLTT